MKHTKDNIFLNLLEKMARVKIRQFILLLLTLSGTEMTRAQFSSPKVAPTLSFWPSPSDSVITPTPKISAVPLTGGLSGGFSSSNSSRVFGNHFPYPIIFVHGLGGDHGTFSTFSDWFSDLAGDATVVGSCLNSQGSAAQAPNDIAGP